MSLIWLLVLGGVLYVGMQYLTTFQTMVQELAQIRSQCGINGAGGAGSRKKSPEEPFVESVSDLKKSLLVALNYMKA